MNRRHFLGGVLVSTVLSACGINQATTPAPQPTASARQPTAIAGVPTAAAGTGSAPAATSRPAAQPTFAFEPRRGGPGTAVRLRGWNFAPTTLVKVRVGLPHPVGEVLVSATADNTGLWSAQMILPSALPSGDPITQSDLQLVVMNDANQSLASAPFAFVPTPAPAPTNVPAPVSLLGAEWTLLASGDLYGDGIETAIGYLPNAPISAPPAEYADFNVAANQVAVVQRNTDGQPWVRMLVLTSAIVFDGSTLSNFPQGGPNDRTAAIRVALASPGAPLRILPVDANGKPAARGLLFTYNTGTHGYDMEQISAPGDTVGWPGTGWQQAASGDFNGDGIEEQVFFRSSAVTPDASFGGPSYTAYTLVADEVMIAQSSGETHTIFATIDRSTARINGSFVLELAPATSGPMNRPAAFLLAAPVNGTQALDVIPINEVGQGYTQGFGLGWSASKGSYQLIGAVFGTS